MAGVPKPRLANPGLLQNHWNHWILGAQNPVIPVILSDSGINLGLANLGLGPESLESLDFGAQNPVIPVILSDSRVNLGLANLGLDSESSQTHPRITKNNQE